MQEVQQWLAELGLSQYAQAFFENQIDFEVLPDLTEADLRELGLPMGPRKKLLKAILALETEQPAAARDRSETIFASRAAEAERRQLTVMFCDLVGSTELSTKLDPEDLRDVIVSFQDHCREAIQQYAGFIARYMGDGMLVYFGYPQAHENDAERAVRAGLAIMRSMAKVNGCSGIKLENELAVRVGIATGAVVVGDIIGEGAAEEAAVVGETPNRAARLQGIAQPHQLVIGPMTRQLVGDLFELDDLGSHKLKGIAEPVQAWRVVCEGDANDRDEDIRIGGGMPLVGRQEELGLLMRSWEASKEGHGQAVLIQGEAGIGKSRLIKALRERVSGEYHIWITIRCSPYHTNSTLFPIIEHVKRVMDWKPEDSAQERLEKLEAALTKQRQPLEEVLPLYAELMSLPLPEGLYAPLELSAGQKRERTLDVLSGWLLAEAERTPVLQVWEDLHWVDPTTLELLGLYIDQSPTVSMLNVLIYRPEFAPPWAMHSHMTPITLNRLERLDVEALIEYQATGKMLPSEVVEHIVDKTDGVPLYVEELTKTILESDYLREETDHFTLIGSLSEVSIPATLQDSLMERLDRLGEAKVVAQIGAVIGREFTFEMLQYLSLLKESALGSGVGQLVKNELLYQRGRPPRSRYIFKHALIQDAAYKSLLRRSRQEYHRRVAEALEAGFPETIETHPEILAQHYTEAGLPESAISYWQRAGELAVKRSANLEAIAHCTRGLDCFETLPKSLELAHQELALQISIGIPIMATKGYGAPRAAAHYHRARELCEQLGETSQLLPVIYGQWLDSAAHGDYRTARAFAEELLHFAEQHQESGPVVVGHRTIAWTDLLLGELDQSQTHVDKGLSLYDTERHRSLVFQYAHDSRVALLGCRAYLEWLRGYPERAVETGNEAIAHARHLEHSNSLAYALCYAGTVIAVFRREPEIVAAAADELIGLSEKQAFQFRHTTGMVFRGWCLAHMGDAEEGIALIQEALADMAQAGQNYARTFYIGLLVDSALANGLDQEALHTLDKAFELVESTGERWWEAELHRLRGQGLAKVVGQTPEAETCYQTALRIAREQGAKSLELRASISLSRLWCDQDKRQDALDLLTPVYDWFTEGFDTQDLRDARILLDELG